MLNDEQLKTMLKTCVEENTQRSAKAGRNMYICPFCKSGTGENATGALGLYENGTKWKCFSCNRGGDIGDFLAEINHTTAGDGMKKARELYGNAPEPVNVEPIKEKKEPANFTDFYRETRAKATGTEYFNRRGFSDKTIKDFNLYCYPNEYGYINAVIPVSNEYYIERGTTGDFKRNPGKVTIFNAGDLWNQDKEPVFICEGWADALSVYEVEGYAIATNSASNWRLVIEALQNKPTESPLIIAYDNDRAGNAGAEKLAEALEKLGYIATRLQLAENTDVNEFLQHDRKAFLKAVEDAEKTAKNQQAKYSDRFFINEIDGILSDLWTGKYNAISTGFKYVDDVLDGGLYPGLTVIGAESSLGKSTLVMNIGENLAQAGEDVLYFTLEMTKAQLLTRGLSRQSFLLSGQKTGKSAGEIKRNEAGNLEREKEAYKNKIARNMIIYESYGGTTVEAIRDKVTEHIKRTGKTPVVIIDYLQMISDQVRQTEMQQIDHSIEILKGLSAEYNARVLCISSLNRVSYGEAVTMSAFKGSGKIEYTADFILGLSLAKCKTGKLEQNEINEEMKKSPRVMMLQVLKGRDIDTRKSAELQYYSKYNCFTEDLVNAWNDYKEQKEKRFIVSR